MSFGILALVVLAGLAGPLLGSSRRLGLPVVVGEVLAGVVVGVSGLGWVDAAEPTVAFLGDIGFAMLMLAAGMHVPLRTPGLVRMVPRAAALVAAAAVLAIPCGLLAAQVAGGGHAGIYILLLSGGSAAVVLPALEEARLLAAPAATGIIIQIALADVAAIVAVPLVLQPSRAGHAAAASLLVSACAALVYLVARHFERRQVVHAVRHLSKERGWALDLRAALLVLFVLCWIALRSGTSILVAGFSAGLVVGALGGPRRLSKQVTGVAQGFFVPLFFVVLGARIDLRALGNRPSLLLLVGVLVAANVAVHLAVAGVSRQGTARGLLATAQLGLPAAIAALGLRLDVLDAGRAAAIVAAGLCSLPIAAIGARLIGREVTEAPVTEAHPAPGA